MEIFSGGDGSATEALWEAQSVAQHHDGVSGTAKQAVTFDYAQRIARGSIIADQLVESALADIVTTTGSRPAFAYCPLANVSQCDVTTSAAAANIAVVFYNQLARHSSEMSFISVPTAAPVQVRDGSGAEVDAVVLPVFNTTANADGQAKFRTWFRPEVQGLGIATYFLTPASPAQQQQQTEAAAPHRHSRHLSSLAPPTGPSVLDSLLVSVNFSADGQITAVTDKTTGMSFPLALDFAYYPSYQAGGQEQQSGAYSQQH